VDDVERFRLVLCHDTINDRVDVALEVSVLGLALRLHPDHRYPLHVVGRAPSVHPLPFGIVAVLREHRHVVPQIHHFAEQVERVDAHPGDGGKEAARNEADAHCVVKMDA
jgi:hypothetical protein